MKKILSAIILVFLFINTTFAYTPTNKDIKTVEVLTSKINKVIQKKWEKTRPLFVNKLTKLKFKVKKDERITYILDELIKNLDNSSIDIEKIISDIEKENVNEQKIANSNPYSEFLIFERYIQAYNNNIRKFTYGLDESLAVDCWTYLIDWNDYYKNEFQEIYNSAVDFNSYFIANSIISDIKNFNKYYKKSCWSTSNLKWLETKVISRAYNDTLFFVYYDIKYSKDFNYLNKLFKEKKESSTFCNTRINEWNNFENNKRLFLKEHFKNNKDYYNKLINNENKVKDLFKKECNWIRLK